MEPPPERCPTEKIYESAGGDDPTRKPVEYIDQRVQILTINQLQKKAQRKRIQNMWIRACVFVVFICSSDDITTCSALVRQFGQTVFLPILICAICVGMPLIYLEMGLGQFTSSNPISIFSNMAPIGKGIGYSMVIVTILDVFRQVHLSTIFANILWQALQPLFGGDFYMTRCLFPYDKDCIDPHVKCAGIGDSYYSRQELQSTTVRNKFYLAYKEENSQCVSNMQVKYAMRGLTAARLSQSSGIERYIDLFLTNVGHNPTNENVPRAAMDYNIAGLLILAMLMLMMYHDTSFIEGVGVFGTIVLALNLINNYSAINKSETTAYNNFVMANHGDMNDLKMWIACLNYVLMAVQVGQAGMITLASSNTFSNNCFRDAIVMAIIATLLPYTIACLLTSNWEKFIVSQMSDMEDRDKYFAAGDIDTGLKNTRNTVHITSTAIFGANQLTAVFGMMMYFLSSTTMRMMVGFRALVRTFHQELTAQFAITWKEVCKLLICFYIVIFMLGNTSSMRLILDAIRVGAVRAMPIIVLGYLLVIMFCYGIRRIFLDLNTMLFMIDKKIPYKAMFASSSKITHDTAKSAMKRYSTPINIFVGTSWSVMLVIAVLLANDAWNGAIREGDLYSIDDAEMEVVQSAIWYFSAAMLSPMIVVALIQFFYHSHAALNGTMTISYLFSPNAFYGPKNDRHRLIVANESNSVRM